jgi:hypothetical protein
MFPVPLIHARSGYDNALIYVLQWHLILERVFWNRVSIIIIVFYFMLRYEDI